jgi:anti-sigma regulatory factor (Ser/Thr protein kinase)
MARATDAWTCPVPRRPGAAEEARRFAERVLSDVERDPGRRDAIAMVVMELADNVVKYSPPTATPIAGTIHLEHVGGRVRIVAVNEVATPDDARSIVEILSSLAGEGGALAMYRSRVAELFQQRGGPRTRLGLLRAAFEGGFVLSCSYEAPVLRLVAEDPSEDA